MTEELLDKNVRQVSDSCGMNGCDNENSQNSDLFQEISNIKTNYEIKSHTNSTGDFDNVQSFLSRPRISDGPSTSSVIETIPEPSKNDVIGACSNEQTHTSENIDSGNHIGGTLKFYKDGKFILEIAHKKEGDKSCWVPVTTKKTFWPGFAPRQESLTSLSASDDNSSIQSPWQREHSLKQNIPQKNIRKELEFLFVRYGAKKRYYSLKEENSIRRKPFLVISGDKYNLIPVKVNIRKRPSILYAVNYLWEKLSTYMSKIDNSLISPRKRILKEFEMVSLEDVSKRHKNRTTGRKHKNNHSISAILSGSSDSVLRQLLKCPSPVTPKILYEDIQGPSITNQRMLLTPQPIFIPQSTSQFMSKPILANPINYNHHIYPNVPLVDHFIYPIPYTMSSPSRVHPFYDRPVYNQSVWRNQQHLIEESPSDMPLNLSKHS